MTACWLLTLMLASPLAAACETVDTQQLKALSSDTAVAADAPGITCRFTAI